MNARRTARFLVASFAMIVLGFGLAAQTGGPRYALVIGNGAYKGGLAQLKNPLNDASDVAAAFKRLGYQVELLIDADEPAMEAAAARLADNLGASAASTGVFYYAGHGVQSQGVNYLIPVDANIPAEAFLKTKALSAQTVLDLMQGAGNKLNLVILDACRDNPFSWSRSTASRGLSVVGVQPPGSIIVFATSAGSTAQDGTGRNGLFTQEFLKNLETPGLDLNATLDRTAAGVQRASGSRQNPAIYKQFLGTAYLGAPPAAPPSGTPAPGAIASAASAAPTMTIQKAYGSLVVNAATAGTLYLDGAKMGELPASSKATLNNIETGERSLELRYGDGQVERQSATVSEGRTTSVVFSYRKADPQWIQETLTAPWRGRCGNGLLTFNNQLWILGGAPHYSYSLNDVWDSYDGSHWTQVATSAAWSTRMNAGYLVFNNAMWIFAGQTSYNNSNSEVWESADGKNWTLATSSPGWSARHDPAFTVFNNRMWIMGGFQGTNPSNAVTLNDVWYSSDGINWVQATAHAPWAIRMSAIAFVYKEYMYVCGGGVGYSDTVNLDIWRTNDGYDWEKVGDLPCGMVGVCASQDSLYAVAAKGDIYASANAVSWKLLAPTSAFPSGVGSVVAFKDKIWAIGTCDWKPQVWSFPMPK